MSMAESIQFPNISSLLYIFFSLLISAASYTPPNLYFINCGSTAAATLYASRLLFAADDFFSGDSTQVEDMNLNRTSLYQSARLFHKPSRYEFNLNDSGIYVVRLHFFPFRHGRGNLSDARFSVSASGFTLLSDLEFAGRAAAEYPFIEEFLIKRDAGKFKVSFEPDVRSFAFVNAIEVFLAPADFVRDSPSRVTGKGSDQRHGGALASPLHVVYRINVGGDVVTRETDTMFRNWIPDDPYLYLKTMARNKTYGGKIKYQSPGSTEYDAPESVYNTAKEMNVKSGDDNSLASFRITWRFEVKKFANYLVRVHFCDIVSNTSNSQFIFNLYICSIIVENVRPYELVAPFYIDFVVVSDDSGYMNISIGPNQESELQTAFLNGVEIMEMIQEHGGASARKNLFKIVCWGIAVGIVVALILIVSFICLRKKKWKPIEEVSEWAFVHIRGGSSHSKTSRTSARTVTGSVHADLNLGLKVPLAAILFATRKFDRKLMIGEGGFGKVYKGKMRDGRKVAVKRSEGGHGQGLQEFHREIMVLSKIRHQHLVSLIGYCDEKNEMILVYEFMENGNLRDHLYGRSHGTSGLSRFSWEQRLKICIGAARGLHYLHTGSTQTIVHRDIKSTNILLDEDYIAKVADFGLSRSGSLEQTHFSTEVKGSFGYLDPEYYATWQLTQKSDVYSFGVVLLEVVCGRTAVDRLRPQEEVSLAAWGLQWQRKGELKSIVDPVLGGKINPNSLRVFGEMVERCLQEKGGDRPDMSDVLWSLEYCLQLQSSVFPRQLNEDSTSDVSLELPAPVVRRLPSDSLSISEDEVAFRYCSFSDGSELGSGVVFSQWKGEGGK